MEENKILETLEDGSSQMQTSSVNPTAPIKVFEIAKVRYRGLLVKIFSDLISDRNPRQFFFEPLVFLDPKSIVSRSHGFFNKNFIRITLQMWTEELRSKVLERLRSLESLLDVKIGEEDVCVMPFEQVKLIVYKPDGIISNYIRLEDQPTSYLRSNENLDFHLLCDALPSSVDVLAEDFRQNTEFTLKEWQLKLECRGLTIKSGTSPVGSTLLSDECPIFSFNITTTHTNESNNIYHSSSGMSMVPNTKRPTAIIIASSSRPSTEALQSAGLSSAAKRHKPDQNRIGTVLARSMPDGAEPQIPGVSSFMVTGSEPTTNAEVTPGQVAVSGRGITGVVGPDHRQLRPALYQLLEILKKPSTPERLKEVVQILRSYPHLMAAFIKQRSYLLSQQEQNTAIRTSLSH